MKKPVRWCVAISAAILLLATACGSAPASTGSTSGKVTLTFWNGFTGPNEPQVKGLVAQWNAAHPNIQVQMTIEPWDTLLAKLLTAMSTGQGPDIAGYDPEYIPQYADSGAIQPLASAYGSGTNKVDKSAVPKSLLKVMTWKGKIYGVPMSDDPLMLFYNTTIFKNAGLQPPKTMSELEQDAVKLTTPNGLNGQQYGLPLADHDTAPNWPILAWSNGGNLTNAAGTKSEIDSPKTVQIWSTWANLIANDHISPVGLAGADVDNLFQSQKAAMEISGPWLTNGLTQAGIPYDVAPMPVGSAGPVTDSLADVMVLSKHTQHAAQAEQFMAFWNSKKSQAYWAVNTGEAPTRTDMLHDSALSKNPYVVKFAAQLPTAQFYLGGVANAAQIDSNVVTPAIEGITRGQPVGSTLSTAAQQMTPLLNKGS